MARLDELVELYQPKKIIIGSNKI